MQYKQTQKILIDKRKLDILIRLNCPKENIYEAIVNNKIIYTNDKLIDETLETLVDIKVFKNWGGNHNPKGNNQYTLGQVEQKVEQGQKVGQKVGQVVDKDIDKDIDIDKNIDTNNNKKIYGEFNNVFLSNNEYIKLKEIYANKLDEAIGILSSYIASKGKKYKNHYAVLGKHNWVYKKINEDKRTSIEEMQGMYEII